MTRLFAGLVLAAVAMVGCEKESPTGGRVGGDTFRVEVPAMAQSVRQGEIETVRVQIDRDAEFRQSVRLEFDAPEGIDVDPSSKTVQAGEVGDLQLKIEAAKDAPLGDHRIVVRATPERGEATVTDLTVSVVAQNQ